MVYSSPNAAFLRDKHQFFSQVSTVSNLNTKIRVIEQHAQTIDHTFLLKNYHALEAEFREMFAVLQKQDGDNKKVFWLYCYYCATLLETFHRAYSQTSKEAEYAAIKLQIKDRLNKVKNLSQSEKSFIQSVYDATITGFKNVLTFPFYASVTRDYVAFSNLCRIYWVFMRLTLVQGFSLANELNIIAKLDAILGTHTDVDKIISTLQAPTKVINYFSVGFFAMRFAIDGGLLLKHTFFPTELEKGAATGCEVTLLNDLPGAASIEAYRNNYILVNTEESDELFLYYIPKQGAALKLAIKEQNIFKIAMLQKMNENQSVCLTALEINELITAQTNHVPEATSAYDRFKHELYKRHGNFLNDLTWGTVNFLCNFNTLVGISGPVAGYLTSAFLVFDILLILYKCNLAKNEYLTKKSQYEQEIEDYKNPNKFKTLTAEQKSLHIQMLHDQLTELEINWQTKEATFYFLASAAVLLMLGFTVAILANPPLLILSCFFVCTIAVAMYLSSDAYSQFTEKSLYLEQARCNGKNLPVAQQEYETARTNFIFTMLKNAIVPTVLIATFAVCWPAAIVLTALYIGAEAYHAYTQHSEKNAIKQLALATPNEDISEEHYEPIPCIKGSLC